ncbi:MAG: hypothetical protein FJZ58_08525, partial [Chlamydiae bacterium]|nr:hypothetical protein [Chlamydiota bacterium]
MQRLLWRSFYWDLKSSLEKAMVEIQECCLRGLPVSAGIAIGRLAILKEHKEIFFAPVAIDHADVDAEILRYRQALFSSRCDLQQLQKLMSVEGSTEAVTIIDTHIQMLEDPLMTTMVEQKIRQMLQNTESVFRSVMGEYEKHFLNMEDLVLRQRLIDVKDLSQRVLNHLHPQGEPSASLPSEAVIFSKELTPSDTIEAC